LSVWANGLWFLSLVISLTCALLATLVQQWARRYQRVAYPRYRPHKRARIHAFYRRGIEKSRIPRAVEALPLLLHIALFVFFAGLSTFLYGVNRTIFKIVTAWMGVCVILYACLSVVPVTRKDSPYSTPLSGAFSFCLTAIRYYSFRNFPSFSKFMRDTLPNLDPGQVHIDNFYSRSMTKTAEKYAFKLNSEIDHDSLLWTFQSLDDDAEFEEFFEGLPRLCDSDTGKKLELKEKYIEPNKEKLSKALIGLMDRTLKFNLVKEFVKHRRMIIFTKAIESKSISLLDPSPILRRVLFEDWNGFLGCIEFGLSMRSWADDFNKVTVTSFYAQCVATLTTTVVRTRKRDERWIQLAKNLPVSAPLHCHEQDDSILLANAIFIVRITVQTYSGSEKRDWDDIYKVSRRTLGAVCKLDIKKALPELQHEFCDLWNKLVTTAQTDQLPRHKSISVKMLRNIRKLYIALHDTHQAIFRTTDDWEQVLDNSRFYPECTQDDHRPSSESSYPDLQFNAPRAPSDARTPRSMQFPEPHTPTHSIALNSPSSPDRPSLGFPLPNPYFPPSNDHPP
jgi:hypothetical protein